MELQFVDKPSRNELFFKHIVQKVRTQKIVRALGGEFYEKKWKVWNFKKNTGYKPIYSCSGYGGRCQGCKHPSDNQIRNKKENLQRQMKEDIQIWRSTWQ